MNALATLSLVNTGLLLDEASGGNTMEWLIPGLFTALCVLLFWFIRDKFNTLTNTDKSIEKNIKTIGKWTAKIAKWAGRLDKRVGRIEGKLKLSPLTRHSPLRLSDIGKEILEKSGIKEITDQFKNQLLKTIQKENPKTAYDVQEATREVFQDFDFGEDNVKKLKDYAFQSGNWGLSDILEVGAIYFRDIALEEFGFDVKDLNEKLKK